MGERVILVNTADAVIGEKERIHVSDGDRLRVSVLFLFDERGRVLLAKRASMKKVDPDKWGPSVAGTNAVGETYESNVIKEAQEEIGLSSFKIFHHEKVSGPSSNLCLFFSQISSQTHFTLDPSEVAETKWMTLSEIEELVENKRSSVVHGLYYFLKVLKVQHQFLLSKPV